MDHRFGQYPAASHTIVHLSDTHLLGGGRRLGGRFDTEGNLARTLAAAEHLGVQPDAIVITGDLTDLGEPEAYRALRAAVEPVAARLDAPLVWVAGNHDERPAMRRSLLDLEPTEEPVTGVWDLGGLRLIALDSTVPGWHHGEIDEAQLSWLAGQLASPAPRGTIVALHHPPLPSHVPLFDILELRDQGALEQLVRGSDVRAIIAGHLHYSTTGTFAGVPVSVASATCYQMDVARPPMSVNGGAGVPAFSLVHVYEHTITHTTIPVIDSAPGDHFSPEWYEQMSALTAAERLERFSRKPASS